MSLVNCEDLLGTEEYRVIEDEITERFRSDFKC
jgi:hypothetical protein